MAAPLSQRTTVTLALVIVIVSGVWMASASYVNLQRDVTEVREEQEAQGLAISEMQETLNMILDRKVAGK